jgi:hypothetical protein
MLIKFTSKAAASVIMYEDHAKRILDLLHKDVKIGVLTPEELPKAIAILEQEFAESKAHSAAEEVEHDVTEHHGEDGDDNEHEQPEYVSFGTRLYPLLEMLREANKNGQNVMWSVL